MTDFACARCGLHMNTAGHCVDGYWLCALCRAVVILVSTTERYSMPQKILIGATSIMSAKHAIQRETARAKFFAQLEALGTQSPFTQEAYLHAFIGIAAAGMKPDEISGMAVMFARGAMKPEPQNVGELNRTHLGQTVIVEYQRSTVTGQLDKIEHEQEVTARNWGGDPARYQAWATLTIGGIEHNAISAEAAVKIADTK